MAILVGLALVFFRGIGRTDPVDQYKALLGTTFSRTTETRFREWGDVDPPSRLETHGHATATAIFDGLGLHEKLTFTVFEHAEQASAAEAEVRDRYAGRETFQDINTWREEFCVRLPGHRLDCFRTVGNLFLHSSVIPLPMHWGDLQPFMVEFEPVWLLRGGYKLWLAYIEKGQAWSDP